MTKKFILFILILFMTAFAVSGCSQKSTDTAKQSFDTKKVFQEAENSYKNKDYTTAKMKYEMVALYPETAEGKSAIEKLKGWESKIKMENNKPSESQNTNKNETKIAENKNNKAPKDNSVDGWVFSKFKVEMHPETSNFHLQWQAVNVSNKQNDIRPAARFIVKKPGGKTLHNTLGEIGTSTANDGFYNESGKSTISVFPGDTIAFTSLWELPTTDKSPAGYVLYYIDVMGNVTPLCNL